MSIKSPSGSDKSLDVVFESETVGTITPMSEDDTQSDRRQLSSKAKAIVRNITKQVIRKQIEDLHTEHEKSNNRDDTKFRRLVKAVEQSSAQEMTATNRFVDNVENMMKDFNKNLNQLSVTCKSILDKLPKMDDSNSKP